MKFSEKWLREWIDPKFNINILHDQISSSGIEVESIEKFEPIFNGVVVGEIVDCIFHPKYHHIKIVKVNTGNKRLLNIVCCASNCRNNIKVAVAIVGAVLKNTIKIEQKIIKGEVSEGMLCSFFDLGLFKTNTIIELSKNTPIGMNVHDCLSFQDNIIKVSITSNRPDGLHLLGIARNIAAMNSAQKLILKDNSMSSSINKTIDIKIQNQQESINYLGRIIENININVETPFWMKKKLFFSDNLSENIITNIINYVLIELGQPLNVLDADSINNCIFIRRANDKEEIVLKNDLKISLNQKILVFADKSKILYIPGNINSQIADVKKNTKNIFLSTFLINKKVIFDIIKTIGSNQILEYYSYGIDPVLQKYALEYATNLIMKICGGKNGPISNQKNNFSSEKSDNWIKVYHQTFNRMTGCSIDVNIISNILYNLEYKFIFKHKYWNVIPPSWRFDILIEEDVISDILRIYGYKNIILRPLQESLNVIQRSELINVFLEKAHIILINKGYYEAITYGFIDPKIQNHMFPNQKQLLLSNPISQDMSSMRLSLWPGLLKSVSYNKNRQQYNIRFFESGLCFSIDERENLGVKQQMFLSAVISGNYFQENWHYKIRKVDFYDLKGDLEYILESIYGLEFVEFRAEEINGLHPEQSASVYLNNKFIGSIGAIDPRLEVALNVDSSTFLFEIVLNNLPEIKPVIIKKISKFPTTRRDISILISDDINVSDIINTCQNFFIKKMVIINIFDVYSCKEFANKKSVGISFVFQDSKRTLKEHEINLMINDCIGVLQKTFQIIIRK